MLYLGNPAGLLVTAEGKTVYHAGDTGLFLDMQLIGQSAPIDTALLPIGDNFTMGIDDAVQAVGFLNPRLALPMHYDTFEIIAADPDQFVTQVAAAGGHAQKIMIGESVEI